MDVLTEHLSSNYKILKVTLGNIEKKKACILHVHLNVNPYRARGRQPSVLISCSLLRWTSRYLNSSCRMKKVGTKPVVFKGRSTLHERNVELLSVLVLRLLCIIRNSTLYCLMLISHPEHSRRYGARHGSFEARATCERLL